MVIKQTFSMLWQNKYFAFLSLFGISVTIAVVMAFFIVLENKTGDIAPEVNASRMAFLRLYKETRKEGKNTSTNMNSWDMPRKVAEENLTNLPSVANMALYQSDGAYFTIKGVDKNAHIHHTGQHYWEIFRFNILSGRGFTDEEFERTDKVALISRKLAEELFMDETPIGKPLQIGLHEYRIVGMVEDVPPVCRNAHAQVWTPCFENISPDSYCRIVILLKNGSDVDILNQEVKENFARLNTSNADSGMELSVSFQSRMEQVMSNESDILSPMQLLKGGSDHRLPYRSFLLRWIGMLGSFMLVTISNLTGINLARIRERSAEMGVRKAFGSGYLMLMVQLLAENMIVCMIGGVLGTLLGYSIVQYFDKQLFSSGFHVFFPINLIWLALGIIIVFGLLSSVIPAYRLAKSNIVSDLNQ